MFFMEMMPFQLKNGTSVFCKRVFVFQKICFKVKLLKTFKIFTDCHRNLNFSQKFILKIPRTFFQQKQVLLLALSVGFKIKPLGKSVFQCSDKNQPKFCRRTCWKEQPIIFTVYLMNHIFQASVLLIRDNRMCNEHN